MSDVALLHLVARTAARARPFQHRIACADLWHRIGRTFDLVACVLMPDHVHVLAQIERESAPRSFARVLSAFRLRMQATGRPELVFDWEPLPQPEKVQHDRRHIARTVRYIHLNPSRDALCNDPLEWEWSTHRDWVGAVARPGVDRARWARAMGRRLPAGIDWLHEYVASDPSVPRPKPLVDPGPYLVGQEKDASLDAIASAVSRVLRSACSAPREFGPAERRLFLLAAARWTRYRSPELARCVGCHPTNARKMVRCGEGEAGRVAHDDGVAGRSSKRRRQVRGDDGISETDATRAGRHRGASASAQKARIRRIPLTNDELRAMALTLADPRLSAMPLTAARP